MVVETQAQAAEGRLNRTFESGRLLGWWIGDSNECVEPGRLNGVPRRERRRVSWLAAEDVADRRDMVSV
jgi:hypothetical protein